MSTSDEQFQLANIFIDDCEIENELSFLEDLLGTIYNQLSPPGCDIDLATSSAYEPYSELSRTGQRASKRIDSIARALRLRTTELVREGDVVLIIDHLDRCSPALQELVQQHLSILQNEGMKILITSRLPTYEPAIDIFCDYHTQDTPLVVFWRCSKCQKRDICVNCKESDTRCTNWYVCSVVSDRSKRYACDYVDSS